MSAAPPRLLTMAVSVLIFLGCSGCASYFRQGAKSYQELDEENRQKQKEAEMWLKPGTIIYTQ